MLLALVLNLVSEQTVTLPGELGRANYSATLDRLGQFDAELARRLHDSDGVKPLTCSGILNGCRSPNQTVKAGETYGVRMTALTEQVGRALRAVLLEDQPAYWDLARETLRPGEHTFRVAEVICDPMRHSWSGQSSHQDLLADAVRAGNHLPHRVTLEFAGATAFKSQEIQQPVPLPALVFGSLIERWNATSALPIDLDMRRIAEQSIGISRYRLESYPVPHKNGSLRIGGVGQVTYELLHGDSDPLKAMNILADFAFYSGVGVQTTNGMGRCRRL